MRLSMMLEPQEGLSYDDVLAVARRVAASGGRLDGLYRSDHYTSVGGREGLDSTDAWATLAGLARDVPGIRLGTLVTPATFRPVGNLAKVVATVAQMAGPHADGGSRVVLGMGTGWLEAEHRQHGFPFADLGTRFARLEEHLRAVTALFDPARDPVDLDGEHVRLEAAVFRPKPVPRPRLVVGGRGLERTPGLAARYADELNGVFSSPARCREQRAALLAACDEVGREEPAAYSLMTGCVVGATQAEVAARLRRLQESSGDGRSVEEYAASLAGEWVIGTVEQARDRLGELADAGVEAVMLQHQSPSDLEMVDLVAGELAAVA